MSNPISPLSVNIGIRKKRQGDDAQKVRLTATPIAFARPDVCSAELFEMRKVAESGWLTNGPVVREFENRIAKISRCDRAVALDSCTAAMELTLRALGIGKGDEIITTPYTYSATAEVIRNVGAKIVFVDLDGESFEMDYSKVEEAITEKTKAVMPVDIGGKMCNYEALMASLTHKAHICKLGKGIISKIGRPAIITDAAHSFGATSNGKVSGEYADFTCFSFHVLKNITTGGEGGAVVWKDIVGVDNDEFEKTLRLLADHGQTSRDKSNGWEYDIALFGYNSIMTDIDAAMGMAQLDRLPDLRQKRKQVTKAYDKLFKESGAVEPLIKHLSTDYISAMHLYPIRLPDYVGEEGRNEIYKALREKGVPCNVHYKPLPMMTAYKKAGFDINDYPNAYNMFKNLLTIPYHTKLSYDEQEYIVRAIEEEVKKYE